jgi:hypothetical protein
MSTRNEIPWTTSFRGVQAGLIRKVPLKEARRQNLALGAYRTQGRHVRGVLSLHRSPGFCISCAPEPFGTAVAFLTSEMIKRHNKLCGSNGDQRAQPRDPSAYDAKGPTLTRRNVLLGGTALVAGIRLRPIDSDWRLHDPAAAHEP